MLHRDVRTYEMMHQAWKMDRYSLTDGRWCAQHSTRLEWKDSPPVIGSVPK